MTASCLPKILISHYILVTESWGSVPKWKTPNLLASLAAVYGHVTKIEPVRYRQICWVLLLRRATVRDIPYMSGTYLALPLFLHPVA